MKRNTAFFTVFLLLFVGNFSFAQSYNNYEKHYELVSQTEAQIESGRTHRAKLCDYQPSGLYIKKGESLTLTVGNMDKKYDLSVMIGFKTLWGGHNTQENYPLKVGNNVVKCGKEGVLYFVFVKKQGFDSASKTVVVDIKGGKAFPLFYLNESNLENWANDLKTMKDAPFVELFSDKATVTMPYKAYLKNSITNIEASFQTIHTVIDWEDELAGFDNSSFENEPTRNRLHYIVDLYATPKEQEDFYMYMMDYIIGMKKDNFTDLIVPENLKKQWSIWHETGHTQQQNSWTWGSIGEVSVNLFSLYVQEKFKEPTRLKGLEDGETLSTFEKAKLYVANPKANYLFENEKDYNELFTKLVLFHQLKTVYGWSFIKKLHQYFRKQAYVQNDSETDQQKVDKFIYASCVVTQNNLLPFFKKWGLRPSAASAQKINALNLKLPATDPATIFK